MARVRKIDDYQFALDCINKEFEIIGSGLHFKTFPALVEYAKEHKKWYSDNAFISKEQYLEWKDYFFTHFYDWKPKRYGKKEIEREFSWFNLQYGFRCDFDTRELYETSN